MENILKTIKEFNLIKPGEVIGVGVSGGSDSMALLHFLNAHSSELDIEVVAIHVDHSIRENSDNDATVVAKFCKANGIRFYKFKINVPKIAESKKEGLEKTARDSRYGVFDALVRKDAVDKIAVAHNTRDQAETILLNLFRGAGLSGATGMKPIRDEIYIRPLLNTDKKAILDYCFLNDIPYVNDQTNFDNTYSRNFIRNVLLPQVEERWPTVVEKLNNFSKDCADDANYIQSQIFDDAVIYGDKTAKIPNSYFIYPNSIISRIIFKAIKKIGVFVDIERVHLEMIKDLANRGENGSKIKLPMNVIVYKEYDYITLSNKHKEAVVLNEPFKASAKFNVSNFGTVIIKRTKDTSRNIGELVIDVKKVPKDAVWRFKENGDLFEKFGGGTKKLKDYLIDKKVPLRLRGLVPVLASGNKILVVAGVEIAESVRVDDTSTSIAKITIS